jgi:hypothetical protein
MDILIFSLLTNFLYYCCGNIVLSGKKSDFQSLFYVYFIGVFTIAFISLFLNFFIPLNQAINSVIYFIIILIFVIKTKFIFNKKQTKFLLISSLVTFLLIIFSNVNRPDAGLYHLPYVSLVNDSKIIFGVSNLHFRFGHISILQYLSAINNNYLFSNNGITIPLASIVSFFYLYFFYDVWKVFKKKETPDLAKFFSLFILIYISFKITRYSSFGNDAVGHLSFFYLISYILKKNIKSLNLNKILIISVFIFTNKPMLGIVFILPAVIFFIKNNFNIKNIFKITFSIPMLLLYLWLIKNIIVSGCLVFPIKSTCFGNLSWVNIDKISSLRNEGNAWVKGWPDKIDNNVSMKEFGKNFNWIQAWSKKHLKYILKIIIPYTLSLLLIISYLKIRLKQTVIKVDKDLNLRLYLSTTLSLVGVISFFLMFPIYRYGYSYIVTFISLLLLTTIKDKIYIKKNNKIFKIVFVFCLIIVFGKQIQKIYLNSSQSMWPNIYTFDLKNKIYKKTRFDIENNFFYYLADNGDGLCMYSAQPCTSYPLENIKYRQAYTYKILEWMN